MQDKESTEEEPFTVVFDDCSKGLGIKIIGGLGEEDGDQDYGIFIRKVLPGGLASENGLLQEGDQLLSVNGESLESITNEGAVELLRDASAANYVKLEGTRDEASKFEYDELLQAYSYSSASSVCDRTSIMSPVSGDNGWMSPTSHNSFSSRNHTHSLRQRCEGSSSGSDHGSTTLQDRNIPVSRRGGMPKITNAAAASMHNNFYMPPDLASTLQDSSNSFQSKTVPPDGASSGTPDSSQFQPSPILSSGISTAQPSTITKSAECMSHLLNNTTNQPKYPVWQDILGRSQSPQEAPCAVNSEADDTTHRRTRRLSLDPFVRLKISKLELALKYLGLEPTAEEYNKMRKQLKVDSNGLVTFKEFVEAAKETFKYQLEEKNFTTNSMMYALNDIKTFTDPPAFTQEINNSQDVRSENNNLKKEIHRLKSLLRDKEDELIRVRQEAHSAVHASQSLRSKVHLVEQAHRAARNMEQDYEEVVRLLESENAQLRQQNSQQVENPALQKRLAVLGCQLRKAEVTKKTYEVATTKLLQFAEKVQDTFPGHLESHSRPESAVSQHSLPRAHHNQGVRAIASEAKDVIRAVRSLLEVEPLPFGWEESYTSDGMKYYMNHITQVTSWQHPLSSIQHTTPMKAISNNSTHRRKQLPSIPSNSPEYDT